VLKGYELNLNVEQWWSDTGRGRPMDLQKTCSSATTDVMWTGLRSNLGLHGKRLEANHLSHSMTNSNKENNENFQALLRCLVA
jgi:hypothetical protein